jgi:hypothetical protein
LLEVQQGKQTLIGYPALVDKLTHCHIEVFDDPDEAARVHRIGLRRLFALQLKEQVVLEKYSGPAANGHAVHGAGLAGRIARTDHPDGD